MSTRKLEDIASNLEDMSETIEEIRTETEARPDVAEVAEKLDALQADMTRAADRIDESLEDLDPESRDASGPASHD